MKEISEKLAFELYEYIKDAERYSDRAYAAAKRGDFKTAEHESLNASVILFQARTHLDWHIEGYSLTEAQAAPVEGENG
jgi:hypothetical protein